MPNIFDRAIIYNSLFISVKGVLKYPDAQTFKTENPSLYKRWEQISIQKFKVNDLNVGFDVMYRDSAPYHHEFVKIIAISYGTLTSENGKLVREIKSIADIDELSVIKQFVQVLNDLAHDSQASLPRYLHTLIGHGIVGFDIPILIKKILEHRKSLIDVKTDQGLIPKILKECVIAKPWDVNVIDTLNSYKFNGNEYLSLMTIADTLGLKYKDELLLPQKLSEEFHTFYEANPESMLDMIKMQSMNQVNLCIQLVNELRQM